MKKLTALVLGLSMASTAAFAGGPVVVPMDMEPVVVVAPTSSLSGGLVVPLLLLALLAAAAAASSGT